MSPIVRRAGPADLQAALALRTAVFVEEQGVPLEDELDGRDGEALHLVAVQDGHVVGTCRLLLDAPPVMKLGRMAVARESRGRGIAGLLLQASDRAARERGCDRIRLAAQLPAVGVYARGGYAAEGGVFLDAGIEHVWMEKRLA